MKYAAYLLSCNILYTVLKGQLSYQIKTTTTTIYSQNNNVLTIDGIRYMTPGIRLCMQIHVR